MKVGVHSFTLSTHAVSGKVTVEPLKETYDALIFTVYWPIFINELVFTVILPLALIEIHEGHADLSLSLQTYAGVMLQPVESVNLIAARVVNVVLTVSIV